MSLRESVKKIECQDRASEELKKVGCYKYGTCIYEFKNCKLLVQVIEEENKKKLYVFLRHTRKIWVFRGAAPPV